MLECHRLKKFRVVLTVRGRANFAFTVYGRTYLVCENIPVSVIVVFSDALSTVVPRFTFDANMERFVTLQTSILTNVETN